MLLEIILRVMVAVIVRIAGGVAPAGAWGPIVEAGVPALRVVEDGLVLDLKVHMGYPSTVAEIHPGGPQRGAALHKLAHF